MPDIKLDQTTALDDTRARLLALEMVTVAALNLLAQDSPGLRQAMAELGAPDRSPNWPEAADRAFMDHLQANVARLAAGISGPL